MNKLVSSISKVNSMSYLYNKYVNKSCKSLYVVALMVRLKCSQFLIIHFHHVDPDL